MVEGEEWYRNAIVVLDTPLPQDLGYREVRPSERPDWEAGESTS